MPGSENLPNGSLLSLLLCPNSKDGCESGARMDSNMDKLMDTNENCFKDGSEVVPAADESTNDRAGVSKKCRGESSSGEKALEQDSYDYSDWIDILPFYGMLQKLVNCCLLFVFVYLSM